MSETMSSPSSDWAKFYQQNLSGQNPDTLFTTNNQAPGTTTTTTNSSTSTTSSLNPEGRVAKPVRRRSRASRRTPTTLLNTDTANFRAMVQQFTGGPAAAFPPGSGNSLYPSGTNFSFGLGVVGQQAVNTNPTVMAPRAGYNMLQLQQPQPFQQQNYMFSVSNNNHGDHNTFLERLQSSSRVAPMMEAISGGRYEVLEEDVSASAPSID